MQPQPQPHSPFVRQGAQRHLGEITARAGKLIREATSVVIASEDEVPGTKSAILKNTICTVGEALANSFFIGAAAVRLFQPNSPSELQNTLKNPLFLSIFLINIPIVLHQLYHFRLKGFIRKQKENSEWSIPVDSKLHAFLSCLKKLYKKPLYLFIAETSISPFLSSLPIFYRTITYFNETTPYLSYSLAGILGILVSAKVFLAEQCSTAEEMQIYLPKLLNPLFSWILRLNLYSLFVSALSAYEVYKFSFVFTALFCTLTGSSTTTLNVVANIIWGTLAPFIFVLTREMLHHYDEKKMQDSFERLKNKTSPSPVGKSPASRTEDIAIKVDPSQASTSSSATSERNFISDMGTIFVNPIRFLTQKYGVKDIILKMGYLFHVGLSFEVFTHPEQLSKVATFFSSSAATDIFQNPRTHLGILSGVMFIGTMILSGTLRCKLSAVPEYPEFQEKYAGAKTAISSCATSRFAALSKKGISCAYGLWNLCVTGAASTMESTPGTQHSPYSPPR